MIARALQWLIGDLKPVYVDGLLYICLAAWGANMTVLTSKEVYEYVNPHFVFYMKWVTSIVLAIAGALKAFRSGSYTEHKKQTAAQENGETK